jgi:hypothetical protein
MPDDDAVSTARSRIATGRCWVKTQTIVGLAVLRMCTSGVDLAATMPAKALRHPGAAGSPCR